MNRWHDCFAGKSAEVHNFKALTRYVRVLVVLRRTINGTRRGFAQKCTKIKVDLIRQNQQNGLSKIFITDKVQEIHVFLSDTQQRVQLMMVRLYLS